MSSRPNDPSTCPCNSWSMQQQQQEVAQPSTHVTSVCKRHEQVCFPCYSVCANSLAVDHTHAHIDKYDAARSVSWLPEVSSSTISPVCYHMGVPCALLKASCSLSISVSSDARRTTVAKNSVLHLELNGLHAAGAKWAAITTQTHAVTSDREMAHWPTCLHMQTWYLMMYSNLLGATTITLN